MGKKFLHSAHKILFKVSLDLVLYIQLTVAFLFGSRLLCTEGVATTSAPRRLPEVPLMLTVTVDVEHVVHRRAVLVPLLLTERQQKELSTKTCCKHIVATNTL